MPPETVFSKFEAMNFGEICIKCNTSTSGADFMYQPLGESFNDTGSEDLFGKLFYMEEHLGESLLTVDLDCQSRDGIFDADQIFAVWDKDEVGQLIARLQRCVE